MLSETLTLNSQLSYETRKHDKTPYPIFLFNREERKQHRTFCKLANKQTTIAAT